MATEIMVKNVKSNYVHVVVVVVLYLNSVKTSSVMTIVF